MPPTYAYHRSRVTCSFAPGTLTAIVGPNGAGKTTYFNLISGQLRASAGEVWLDGENLSSLPAPLRTRRGLGRAFQLTQLFPNLSVLENVRLAVQARATGREGGGFDLLRVWLDRKAWLDEVQWDDKGLVPAIAQEAGSGRILMVAWMNREALAETAASGRAVYWSRSRGRLWRKGEESGHGQKVHELRLDCDGDVIVLVVDQIGGIACHTGRRSCFFRRLENSAWQTVEPVLKDPGEIYR